MSVIPPNQQEAIQFCESHTPIWSSTPTAIGLTAAQVTALDTLTKAARTAFTAAQNARQASKAATTTLDAAVRSMRLQAADLVRVVKGYAELQNNPAPIYAAAQIPPPAAPSPLPAPGKPQKVSVNLEADGSITLSWISTNAGASTGAFFNITRKLPGQAAFTSIGGAPGGTRESRRASFTDSTVPASAASAGVQYIITGQRGTTIGEPSDAVIVQFGADGTGARVEGAQLKMAA